LTQAMRSDSHTVPMPHRYDALTWVVGQRRDDAFWPIASFRVRAISRFWSQADIGRKHMVTLPQAGSHLVI